MLSQSAVQYLPAFRSACLLLVLLSSFPALEDEENDDDDTVSEVDEHGQWLAESAAVGPAVRRERRIGNRDESQKQYFVPECEG